MSTATVHSASLRRLIGAAVLALLLTQWMALVHAVAHAPRAEAGAEFHADIDGFGHRADSAACQLIDHLLTGQAAGEPVRTVAAERGACEPLLPAQGVVATRPLRLQPARGPPLA